MLQCHVFVAVRGVAKLWYESPGGKGECIASFINQAWNAESMDDIITARPTHKEDKHLRAQHAQVKNRDVRSFILVRWFPHSVAGLVFGFMMRDT